MTYMDINYLANSNLLSEALKDKLAAFQYISAINGDKLKHPKVFEAKKRFVEELQSTEINHCVLRPNGFFSDMKDFLAMAKCGRVYLFGDGNYKLNPIDGEDLTKVCVNKMESELQEASLGGPDIITHNELATLSLKTWVMPIKIYPFTRLD